MDSLPKRPNAPPSPPRRGPRHVSPPTVQRPGPSSWEPLPRGRSPQSWDREPPRGRPMFRPRSRSRSRSFEFEYDFQPRRSPPPPHPGSRLPRRAWERSRSRSPPPLKSAVLCKYFSRPTGCDKGNRCRFRHQRPRSRSVSRSRSFSRSPPPVSRSRSPPHFRRGESPMFIPRGGLRSPPSLLQRLGPVAAPMRQVSPPRTGPVSRDATEPLEEGEERSPGRKMRKPRGGRGRKRPERGERGNWDSFVAADEDQDNYPSGDESRRMFEPRQGRTHSRSPQAQTRSPSRKSKSRSRSPSRNVPAVLTRSTSWEKRSQLSPRSPSHSPSRSPRSRSLTRSQDNPSRSHAPSGSRSRSRTSSPRPSRSRSHSPYRRSRHEREPWAERDRKNASPAPNPGSASATVSAPDPSPAIPTGPRWRPSGNLPPVAPRNALGAVRGGPPPTGPRGDREPPRGPRNMMISGTNTGPSATGPNTAPAGWERPQSQFQSYYAAVQSKLVEREGKKKEEEDIGPNDGPETSYAQVDSNAMDIDVKVEPVTSASGSHLNTPAPEQFEGSRITSPEHSGSVQALPSIQASPASGPSIPLPTPTGPPHPNAQQAHIPPPQSHPLPQVHPLPLPPRPRSPPRAPRSPPRGPRATRGLPEKPKAMGASGQDFSRERDRDRDSVERGARDRNASMSGVQPPEVERKVHALPTNPARRPRVPVIRATKREPLFPDLEKEIASLEEQRVRLANEHIPHAIAFRQAVHDLTLSTIDYRAAEDRRVMTETVLEAMVKGTGVAAAADV